jgi:hypothetical protein
MFGSYPLDSTGRVSLVDGGPRACDTLADCHPSSLCGILFGEGIVQLADQLVISVDHPAPSVGIR